ncbi:phage shock protein operon transcriptional activator [Pedomonas mirosovicensis]|uniref:phage shock protein operon transcriptional activator n=1 Tax=Pedomonas mirosovicensis TaxID=2908641 RepID=UPI0021677740|nr:phage shock protein operon transcriptional activator [Pedomonas mirosovicensis]MCH8686059.1 phage shock protein operon transcriptional activator [Pedomonas mirosovicensis]
MIAEAPRLVGQAGPFLDALDRVSLIAPLNRSVLVIGERGTGKELIAERLHRLSTRWDGPFVQLNCATLPETLIDAELFGHEAGAFTGATKARAGRFEEADGGTLFLDEIATLTPQAQEKLLRVIEYGQLQRIGASRPIEVDVRVVGATNEDLPRLAEEGRFRADLLDRLSFDVVTLPPLRHRQEDIPVLAEHFGQRMAVEMGWDGFPGFSEACMAQLLEHPWPGNVRELKNAVERAVYRWGDPYSPIERLVLDPFESPWRPKPLPKAPQETGSKAGTAPSPAQPTSAVPAPEPASDFRAAVAAYERQLLSAALERARFNQREAASALGLTYDQLRHALRKQGLL